MFGKNSIPQRKPFELTSEEITEDIEDVCLDEEQRNKLYFCLDNKPPRDQDITKVENLLKDMDNLDEAKQKLDLLTREVDSLIENIDGKVKDLQQRAEQYLKS